MDCIEFNQPNQFFYLLVSKYATEFQYAFIILYYVFVLKVQKNLLKYSTLNLIIINKCYNYQLYGGSVRQIPLREILRAVWNSLIMAN